MSQPKIEEMIRMPWAAFVPSPFNRERSKRYSVGKLKELGESMRKHGQIEPVIARWIDGEASRQLELIAGERRWRAASELGDLLVIIRELDDREVCGVMLSENLDRENPSAVEKADIFADMLKATDGSGALIYPDYQALGDAVGESEQDIKNLMKLREAPDFLLEAVEDDRKVAVATAVAVGRIPMAKDREKAAREILAPEGQEVPMNYEQAKAWIRERYMVSLVGVGFDITDETLLAVKDGLDGRRICGGACAECPHYAGNMAELQEALAAGGGKAGGGKAGVNPKTCTNPEGVRLKLAAAWRIVKAHAEERGMRVVEGDAARKVFGGWRGSISPDAGYVDLDAKPSDSDVNYKVDTSKLPKWRKLVDEADVEKVAAWHPVTHKVVYLAPRKEALALLKSEGPVVKRDEGAAEARELGKLQAAKTSIGLGMLFEAVHERGVDAEAQRLLLEVAISNAGSDGAFCLGKWLELPKGTGFAAAVLAHIDAKSKALSEAGETRDQALKQMLEAFMVAALVSKMMKWQDVASDGFVALAKHYQIDPSALNALAKARVGKKGKKTANAPEPAADDEDEDEASGDEPRPAEDPAKELVPEKATTKERVAAPEAEAIAFAKWKETRSIKEAAEAAGVAVDTVKNWHKRRKWVSIV